MDTDGYKSVGTPTTLTARPRMSEANLSDPRFHEGIKQLRSAVECKSLTKGEAGLHVLGSLVLKSFRQEDEAFVFQLACTLNSTVCADLNYRFESSPATSPHSKLVLNKFTKDNGLVVLSAGWLALVDGSGATTDRRLVGVFVLPNGRKGVGIFQVMH